MKKLSIPAILARQQERPFPLPATPWKYYQEWHDVIFAHWKVASGILQPLIPAGLNLDLLNGEAWVSLVAFSIERLGPRYLPSFPPLSNFHEVNIRTYVTHKDKPGIYFLSLETQKRGSAFVARMASMLPYIHSQVARNRNLYLSHNSSKGYSLSMAYRPQPELREKNELERWLLERYCLFNEAKGKVYGIDVHHRDWPLQLVEIERFDVYYRFGELRIAGAADLYHYSEGVQVLTWGKKWI